MQMPSFGQIFEWVVKYDAWPCAMEGRWMVLPNMKANEN